MKQLFHLEPVYKSFVWAGHKLIDQFGIETNLDRIGTIYCVIALPGELDNWVREANMPLSYFYTEHRNLFGCEEKSFPVRMTITCNEGFQSYQLHPDDSYALAHEGCRGKVSGAVRLIDGGGVHKQLFGHRATSLTEFKKLVATRDWDKLFSKINVRDGNFLHTPAGVIHGGWGNGDVAATFGTNSDITYRFFDNDRHDPTRPLSLEDVYRCVHIPELPLSVQDVCPACERGLQVCDYHDVNGEYVGKRLKVDGSARYEYDGFLCIANVAGRGSIDGVPLELGKTMFVPYRYGPISLAGFMDCIMLSYHSIRRSDR